MNSDGKKVLIMGVISIAISALALYSFRDVKFKNTKKTIEEYERQQIENQLSAYENNQNIPENMTTTEITTGTLSILMPNFLANSGFENIVQNLENEGVDIKISYTQSMDELKGELKDGMRNYDLYLIPSDWKEGLEVDQVYLGENIKPYFIPFFQDILSEYQNTFIPYSLDPFVTITKMGISDVDTWTKLFSYTTLWSQEKAYGMPIIWGIGNSDIELLKNGTGPFENYFEILYWQLQLIKKKGGTSEINNMLDTEKIDLSFKYNFESFYNIYSRLIKTNQYCEYYPAICMFAYNFGDIKFGFISDFDILDKYFSDRTNNFVALKFTNSDKFYPIRAWGFVVPRGNTKKDLAVKFLDAYISNAVDGDSALWGNTLPAINNMYNEKKTGSLYKNIMEYEDAFVLILENINLQDNFISDSKNINLLQGFYSPEVYVNT